MAKSFSKRRVIVKNRTNTLSLSMGLPAVVMLTLFLGAMIYQYRVHPGSSFLIKSLGYGLAPVVLILITTFLPKPRFQKRTNSKSFRDSWIVLLICLVAYIIGAGIYSVLLCIKDFYLWIQTSFSTKQNAKPLAVIMTLLIGLILFGIRMRFKVIYGFTEVVVGLFVAGSKIEPNHAESLSQTSFLLGLLTAGIYLVVRGLDNMHQGLTKAPFDPVALKIKSLLNKSKKDTSKELFSR